jgi:hypothetical protein
MGGPKPRFPPGYPFWFAYWDGQGDPPWTEFQDTRFEKCQHVHLPAWCKGKIVTSDAPVWLDYTVGHFRTLDLEIESWCDAKNSMSAVGIGGPPNLTTQVSSTPPGTYFEPPSDLHLRIACNRTPAAIANNIRHICGFFMWGGLLDGNSIDVEVSGTALAPYVEQNRVPGFVMPRITTSGFTGIV